MTQPIDRDTGREFLKDFIRLHTDFSRTDQNLGIPAPPVQKPYPPDAQRIDLKLPDELQCLFTTDLTAAIRDRISHRHFQNRPLTLDELAYLLWATQGVRESRKSGSVLRTVPSAGCRHALETYLCVFNVEGLDTGIYRYLPLEHQLLLESNEERLAEKLGAAALGQQFAGRCAVSFIWTAIPYRMEWRYGTASYKVIALDAGHVCQNLYLACDSIKAGTCAIAAYHQQLMDKLLKVDGENEFVIYLAPVGKV